MPVILARIDDRLIHGQVTVGWSERLHPDRILPLKCLIGIPTGGPVAGAS